MSQLTQCAILLLVVHSAVVVTTIDLVNVPGNGETGICLVKEERDAAIQNVSTLVHTITDKTPNLAVSIYCGAGQWDCVAHLNMSNSSQQCPSAWREYRNNGVRGCRRQHSTVGSCHATFYPTSRQYSRVCGRVIGYQIGSTDAFGHLAVGYSIDSYYVYGVSVTHGACRNHIWTLAAGVSEGGYSHQTNNCPCSKSNGNTDSHLHLLEIITTVNQEIQPAHLFLANHLYSTDPLWDGHQCEGQCYSNGKSPPWFSVDLPNTTTDDIEVHICIPRPSYDNIVIQLLELYIQYK